MPRMVSRGSREGQSSDDAGAASSSDSPATFRTTLLQAGKTATGFVVPPAIVEKLTAGKRPPVRVTINGHTYRNTVAVMGGRYMIGVSAAHRDEAGVRGGEEIEVQLMLDMMPREVDLPADFAAALAADPGAKRSFESLSYSKKQRHVLAIAGAKTPETKGRRIAKAIKELKEQSS